ncbi:MAG: glycosyltransferase family 39 protein [Polyangiaceae bacterium]|nr:glycosyltransferase family 39 protein [Polyangiaceae bacterium]
MALAVVAALSVTLLRVLLRRRLEPAVTTPVGRWRPADVAWLLVAIGVALVLRVAGLESRPVDNDEPVGLGLASVGAWATETDARLHPPLPALVMTWLGGASEISAARSVSVLAGVATVALAFAVVRASAGRGLASLAALWLAAMPAAVHTSQLARGYALCAFGLLAAHACLERALATGRERWFVLCSLAAVLALASEYWALPPLLAGGAVALVAARRQRTLVVGVIGSLGAALTLAAFFAPFALPTLWLGVGGGPHLPTGLGRALVDALALASGPAAPMGALLALSVVADAARRRALERSERMAVAAVVAAVVTLLAASAVTAVRARYLLPVLPLFVCLVCAGARGVGALVLGGVVLGHVSLLPSYFAGTAPGPELSTGERTPRALALLRADPTAPVLVVPAWAIAEVSYRLEGKFPGKGAGACPSLLCVRGKRTIYGGTLHDIPGLTAREESIYLWVRNADGRAEGCELAVAEARSTLYRCQQKRTSPNR